MLAISDLRGYRVHAFLDAGVRLCIRAIGPDDKDRLANHFDRLSPDSRYRRFFGFRKGFTPEELRYLTEPDFLVSVALVATIDERDGRESIVGDGRYVALPDGRRAELALSVIDAYQRKGIGSLLLRHLVGVARHTGIGELQADILASNRSALRFFMPRGFKSMGTSTGVCRVALSLRGEAQASVAAVGLIERGYAGASLERCTES
jgi:GNAT superfamily N-acetyltransferase